MNNNRILAFCIKYNIDLLYIDTCHHFITCLIKTIIDKYPGSDVIDNDELCAEHFKFWWNKISENFLEITNIDFKPFTRALEYFFNIMMRTFYKSKIFSESIVISNIDSLFDIEIHNDNEVIYNLNKLFSE